MDNKKILKNIIDAKRKNPYTENKTVNQLRKETETAGTLIPLPKNIKFKNVIAGNVNAELITCGDVNENRIFMFMHGGGYYRGSVAASRATVARISAEAKVKCLSINYRLAPEHPFPAAIYDTYSAYEWLINEGISPEHIIVSGQSAGGAAPVGGRPGAPPGVPCRSLRRGRRLRRVACDLLHPSRAPGAQG